jgi:hypothetical protein
MTYRDLALIDHRKTSRSSSVDNEFQSGRWIIGADEGGPGSGKRVWPNRDIVSSNPYRCSYAG